MSNYTIFTDSACDISPAILDKWGVKYCSLTFVFDDSEEEYLNFDMPSVEFYKKMRDGRIAKTSAVSVGAVRKCFESELSIGNDILYIGFSSGLSTTFHSAQIAAEDLLEKYPDRKIVTIDSLCASAGQGLLVYLAVLRRDKGLNLAETAEYIEGIRLNICHWFTVDDLVYLKRGGRISSVAASIGGMLGIKPVLHTDNEGHLINVSKTRGRKSSIKALSDKYGELSLDRQNGTVFISHGDCMDDAESLRELLLHDYGASVEIITDVGPVIGAHSGPGTLALFFVGKER